MAQQNRTTLKGYFNTGDTPTEAQFSDFIDSAALVSELPEAASAPAWGDITGTLSAQTDLANALAGKAAADHDHAGAYATPQDVTDAVDAVDVLDAEAVQDTVGAMFAAGTQTRATVTYDDAVGSLSILVDDMTGGGGASVDDTAFAASWDGVTSTAPSKNAVYDRLVALDSAKLNASAVSTFGGTLIDDTSASAARSTLGLGSASTSANGAFATSAQGTKADTALQPGDAVERTDPTGITGASAVDGILAFDTQANLDAWASGAGAGTSILAFTTEGS